MPFLYLENNKEYRIYCAVESASYYDFLEKKIPIETSEKVYPRQRKLERIFSDKKL